MVILETLVQEKTKQNNYLKPMRTENNINTL